MSYMPGIKHVEIYTIHYSRHPPDHVRAKAASNAFLSSCKLVYVHDLSNKQQAIISAQKATRVWDTTRARDERGQIES